MGSGAALASACAPRSFSPVLPYMINHPRDTPAAPPALKQPQQRREQRNLPGCPAPALLASPGGDLGSSARLPLARLAINLYPSPMFKPASPPPSPSPRPSVSNCVSSAVVLWKTHREGVQKTRASPSTRSTWGAGGGGGSGARSWVLQAPRPLPGQGTRDHEGQMATQSGAGQPGSCELVPWPPAHPLPCINNARAWRCYTARWASSWRVESRAGAAEGFRAQVGHVLPKG